MTRINLDTLIRTVMYEGHEVVVLRPGIAVVLYSEADLAAVMRATADVLAAYLDYVPTNAIAAIYEPGRDEYTPGQWLPFRSGVRDQLLDELRSGKAHLDDGGFGFVLSPTLDGHAGDYGVQFGGIDVNAALGDDGNETSVLRLELPWNLLETVPAASLIDFVARVANSFPVSGGHAGFSFNHTLAFVPEAREEIDKLLPRFIGFDSAHTSMQLEMRGRTAPAQWLNLLSNRLVDAVGGEEKLRAALKGCEVQNLKEGVLIRAANVPPVGDVNRGAPDIGLLPRVAQVLKPIRMDNGLFAGLADAERGQAWLERFDSLAPLDWDNA